MPASIVAFVYLMRFVPYHKLPLGVSSFSGSPVCPPHSHLVPSRCPLSSFPLCICFLTFFLRILLSSLPLPCLSALPVEFSHLEFLSISAPSPDLLYGPSSPLSQKSHGRRAGNEICFSPHSTPYHLSSSAPSSFTCCLTGPALY